MKKSIFNKTVNNQRDINADIIRCKSLILNGLDLASSLITESSTNTFTNKSISGSTNTLSNIQDSSLSSKVVITDSSQTLTNKTISGSTNTLSNIQDSSLSSNIPKLNIDNVYTGTNTLSTLKTNSMKPISDLSDILIENNAGDLLVRISPTTGVLELNNISSAFKAVRYENIAGTELKNISETLTNKTISGSSNTISNIQDSALSSNIPRLDVNNTFSAKQTINVSGENYDSILVNNSSGSTNSFGLTFRATDETGELTRDEVGIASVGGNPNRLACFSFDSINAYVDTSGIELTGTKTYRVNGVNIMDNVPKTNTTNTFSQAQIFSSTLNITGALQYYGVDMVLAKSNSNDISSPTVSNNLSQGYSRLSTRINTTNDTVHTLVDFSGTDALWKQHVFTDSTITNTINSTNSITTTSNISGANFITSGCSLGSSGLSNVVGDITISPASTLNVQSDIKINGNRILTDRQVNITDSVGGDESTKINSILSVLRTHGLIG